MKRRTVDLVFGQQTIRREVQLGDLAIDPYFIEYARVEVERRQGLLDDFRRGTIVSKVDMVFPDSKDVEVRPVGPSAHGPDVAQPTEAESP